MHEELYSTAGYRKRKQNTAPTAENFIVPWKDRGEKRSSAYNMLVSEISRRCDWSKEEEEVIQLGRRGSEGGRVSGEEKLSGKGDNLSILLL